MYTPLLTSPVLLVFVLCSSSLTNLFSQGISLLGTRVDGFDVLLLCTLLHNASSSSCFRNCYLFTFPSFSLLFSPSKSFLNIKVRFAILFTPIHCTFSSFCARAAHIYFYHYSLSYFLQVIRF